MPFLASVVLAGAAAGSAAPPAPRVDIAAVNAMEFCAATSHQSNVKAPAGYVFYQSAEGPLATVLASKRIPTTADAPPLVQRFAAMSWTGRLGGIVGYFKAPASSGAVWIVFGTGRLSACDVMVTGAEKIAEVQDAIVNGIRSNPKWSLQHTAQASDAHPIKAAVFTQAAPTADKPGFGLRLKIEALRSDFAKSDGIQLEANVAAGNLTVTPTEISITQ